MNNNQQTHLIELANSISETAASACFSVMSTSFPYAGKHARSNENAMGRFAIAHIFRRAGILAATVGTVGFLGAKMALGKTAMTPELIRSRVEQSCHRLYLRDAESLLRAMKQVGMGDDGFGNALLPDDLDETVAAYLREKNCPLLANLIDRRAAVKSDFGRAHPACG
jgi:hypothetical protein